MTDKTPEEVQQDELAALRNQVATLEKVAQQQHKLAEAYRAQINAIILILKSPVT